MIPVSASTEQARIDLVPVICQNRDASLARRSSKRIDHHQGQHPRQCPAHLPKHTDIPGRPTVVSGLLYPAQRLAGHPAGSTSIWRDLVPLPERILNDGARRSLVDACRPRWQWQPGLPCPAWVVCPGRAWAIMFQQRDAVAVVVVHQLPRRARLQYWKFITGSIGRPKGPNVHPLPGLVLTSPNTRSQLVSRPATPLTLATNSTGPPRRLGTSSSGK